MISWIFFICCLSQLKCTLANHIILSCFKVGQLTQYFTDKYFLPHYTIVKIILLNRVFLPQPIWLSNRSYYCPVGLLELLNMAFC